MRRTVELQTATQADVNECYGDGFEFPFAMVMLRGDDILGICGYFFCDDKVVLFADLGDEAFKYPLTLIKGAKRLVAAAKLTGFRVVTLADDREEARRTLVHLGFSTGEDGWEDLPIC